MSLRQRLWFVVDQAPQGSGLEGWSRAFDVGVVSIILLSTVNFVLATEASVREAAFGLIVAVEATTLGLFVIEYLLRVVLCTQHEGYRHPVTGRLRFMLRPMMLIDLMAIIAGVLPIFGLEFGGWVLVRLARLVKLARYSKSLSMMGRVLRDKREDLTVAIGFISVLMVVAATLMWAVEREAQPEHFGSVPESLWWAIITLTTIGYGDVYPITAAGKALAAGISLLGIGLVGVPTGILAAGFTAEAERRRQG